MTDLPEWMMSTKPDMGWWTLSGEDLMDMLRRVRAGESPDMVYMEAYVNSDIERFE